MWKARLLYLLFFLGAAAFVIFYRGYVAFVLFVLISALPVLLFLLLLLTMPFLQINPADSGVVAARGQPGKFRFLAENRSFLPISSARLTVRMMHRYTGERTNADFYFPIASRTVTTLEADAVAEHCGKVDIVTKRLVVYDFLGITALVFHPKSRMVMAVLPVAFPIEAMVGSAAREDPEGVRYDPDKRGDDSSQVFDYHEYRDGDHLKSVNWKLTARLGRMMVKELSLPLSSQICIALEIGWGNGASPEKRDAALDCGASLSAWLSEQGVPHDLLWYSAEEGCAVSAQIERSADWYDALKQMYDAPPGNGSALLEEISGQGKPAYSSVLYVAAEIEGGAELFLRLGERVRLTVCAGECAPETALVLKSKEIPLLLLQSDSGEQGLENIVINSN